MAEILVAHLLLLANIDELAQVLGKEKIKCPVECYTNFLLESWQFAQIDRSPHPPRQKTGDIYAEYAGHPGAMSDGCKLADCFEFELSELAAVCIGQHVVGNDFSLPKSMLRGGRAVFAGAQVGNQSAIAQRPHARP